MVDQILQLKKSGSDASLLENRIDEMVFDLYDLSPAERDIVRGGTA